MVSLTDSASNETEFAFDLDGRLAEVNHPVEDLQTRYRYDLVGKLLESRVALGEDELWKLNYSYNLAGERLSQHSVWEDGGNAFEYRLDASGRLIRESINRFVCDGVQDFAEGVNDGTAFALDGKLRLLARDDDFSATYLDLQRWEIAISEPVATSVSMVQNDGLRWRTSVGETLRNGRVLPAGTPIDSSNVASDYPHIADAQVADTVGWFEGRMLLRHRMPLTGAFDVQIALSDFDVFGASIGLGVTRDRFETGDGANRFPTDLGGVIDANGCDIVVEKDTDFLARFNDEELADVTVTKLRLKRFLDGSDWKLSAYYHDGEDWVTDEAWVGIVDDQELFAYLHLSGKVGYLRWSEFLDTVGDPYPTAGEYTSRTYDAGRSVNFTRISWNEDLPTGTDVSFQVAASEDANGPWSYGSALTTAAGTTITSTTGRYARFKVSMTSDGSDTPVINDVQVTHDGTSGSRVTRWEFDQAGDITSQARVTDGGTETDTRTYNSSNEIETSSGGWSYSFDAEGNMIGKNNGTTEGCEKWELSWNESARLTQVKKGVYDATPALVNEFTVDYQYDEMGRMLRRDDGTDVTEYFYDGWDLFKETTGESLTEYLVPGLGIHSFLRDGELHTLHYDGLGSVRAVSDSGGAVVARMEFGVHGELLAGSFGSASGGLGFIGALGVRTDPLTGMSWMRYRWYDSSQARFLSRDPIGIAGDPNLYTYASNNPASKMDPSGLITWQQVGWGLAAAAGGLIVGFAMSAPIGLGLGALAGLGAAGQVASLIISGFLLVQAKQQVQEVIAKWGQLSPNERIFVTASFVGGLYGGPKGYKLGFKYSRNFMRARVSVPCPQETAGSQAPLSDVFNGHQRDQGFPGVWNSNLGKVAMKPSTPKGVECPPPGWVKWNGGHLELHYELGGEDGAFKGVFGFTAKAGPDGSVNVISWRSAGVNGRFPNNTVPSEYQPQVLEAISQATGRKVNP